MQQGRIFESLLSATVDFVYLFDLQGRFVFVNKALLDLWGLPLSEAVGKTFLELPYPVELATTLQRQIEQVISSKLLLRDETRYVSPAGVVGYYEYIFSPILAEDGSVELVAGTTRDISAHKETQRALLETQQRLDVALRAGEIATWALELDGDEVSGDENLQRIFGVSGEAAQGGKLALYLAAVHPDDLPAVKLAIEEAIRAGASYVAEYRVRGDEGERWVVARGTVLRDPSGRPLRLHGVVLDITQRKLAEQSLRESEARFRNMSDHAPVMIWMTGADGRCEYVNRLWCQFTGQRESDALGLGWLEALHPEDAARSWAAFEQASAEQAPLRIEYRLRNSDGQYRFMLVAASPRFGSDHTFLGYIGSVIDLTDQRRAMDTSERLLESERHARGEAERTSRIKDEFLATLSHELRTPLNAILGWSQLVKRSITNPVEVARGLEIIDRNARAQTQIIEDLLDMSSIISGKVSLRLSTLELAAVISGAVETIRPTAEAKAVRLSLSLPAAAGALVKGDPHRLQQVFWNLLSNAVKFTPRGGSIQVELNERDGLAEVLIRDSGEGIAPEFLPYVFDRFRQGDASTTRRHGGLGLGLSIVKQLVELHGGAVRVQSERRGAGTTFTVSLPLMGDEPFVEEAEHAGTVVNLSSLPARELEYARGGVELSGLRVVVLDDEPDARLFVKRLLEDRGAEATVVATASEAFELVRSGTFDALLSDIGMPGEDGYSLIERVRALSPDCGGSVPAIALTAYARQADRARALAAGFSAHLSKPLQPSTLVQELGRITGRAGNSRIPPSNGGQG